MVGLYMFKFHTFQKVLDEQKNFQKIHNPILVSPHNHTNHTEPSNDEEECPVEHVIPVNSSSQCMFIFSRDDCMSNEFLVLYYCVFVKIVYPYQWIATIIFFVVGVFLVLMMFYMIADTADAYFAPAIVKICDALRLPSAIAGVTLLAFGNGSPDLFSILAGLMTQNTSLALSAPIGAGVFVSGVVFGLVIIFSSTLDEKIVTSKGGKTKEGFFLCKTAFKVDQKSFLRDMSFYIIAICVVFFIYFMRFTNIFAGLLLIGIYCFYVILVIIGRLIYVRIILPRKIEKEIIARERSKKKTNEKTSLLGKSNSITDDLFNSDSENENEEDSDDPRSREKLIKREVEKYIERSDDADWTGGWNIIAIRPSRGVKERQRKNLKRFNRSLLSSDSDSASHNTSINDDEGGEKSDSEKEESRLISSLIQEDYFDVKNIENKNKDDIKDIDDYEKENKCKEMMEKIDHLTGWSEYSFIEKIIYIIFGWYTRFVRDLTTPKSEKEEWNKFFAVVSSCMGVLFFVFTFLKLMGIYSLFDWSNWTFLLITFVVTLIVGLIFALIVCLTSKTDRQPIYMMVLIVLAFCVSICWIYNCAECLVKILTVFGKLIGIPPAFLGLTVLAWGNSFPDMVSNVVIARKGYPQMAVGSCVGEPLLNCLIGVGVLFTWMSVDNLISPEHNWCYPLDDDPALLVSLTALLFQSIMSLIVVSVMKFRVRKWYGFVLIGFYFLQLTLALVATFVPQVGWVFSQVKIPFLRGWVCPGIQ